MVKRFSIIIMVLGFINESVQYLQTELYPQYLMLHVSSAYTA